MRLQINILIGLLLLFARAHGQTGPAGPELIYSDSLSSAAARAVEIEPSLIRKVDSIAVDAIERQAFPGVQILVAHQGEIVFHKTYGFHTYDSIRPVAKSDIYDLASITKILGPLPALMKLVEAGKLNLDEPLSTYWKPWRKITNKKALSLRQILAHQAGLVPYIAFQQEVVKDGKPKKKYLSSKPSRKFNLQAYEGLYVSRRFKNRIHKSINRSYVNPEKKYRYSGLTFLIFPELIAQLSGSSYEYFLRKNFFLPMGALSLGFNPMSRPRLGTIVPTEIDSIYRKTLVKGYVHDENASLMGGVSGNAGLFGNAVDLYKFMQLYQNYGTLDGRRYLKSSTVAEFSRVQFPENNNRRGLGFDKPLLDNGERDIADAYPAPGASPQSFGHSGFTGTFAWADPENQLVFILLSNRVYPSREHRQLYELNLRPVLQQLFYNAISGAEDPQ